MDVLHSLFVLIISALCGASIGSFFLLTVIYRPLLTDRLDLNEKLLLYRRYYRLNTILCLVAGILSALSKLPQIALILSIMAASHVFANMHILKGMQLNDDNRRLTRSLTWSQNLLHFLQFLAAGYVIYSLR